MTRINLLPWREQQRKERERQVYIAAAGAAIIMLLVVIYVHFHISGLIEEQNSRNAFLENEIKLVEAQIKEIQDLDAEKSKVLSRMKVIEQLQSQRPQAVHLFDELVRTLPEGVYLTNIKQNGATITIEGIAQSNARVSALMRNIDNSSWVGNPRLNVIESSSRDNVNANKFVLELKQITLEDAEASQGDTGKANSGAKKGKSAPKVTTPKKAG